MADEEITNQSDGGQEQAGDEGLDKTLVASAAPSPVEEPDAAAAVQGAEGEEPGEDAEPAEPPMERFEVMCACLRCGTQTSNAELERLPEIKCICGFRVFTKVRSPMVRTVRAV